MSDEITVMLVDDHSMVRQGVRAFLETQSGISVIGEASSGEEAVALAAELAPDVVLMDLMMPGIGGIAATRQLRAASPHTQVIVLTSYHEDEQILPAIQAGALSYLLKDVQAAELAAAVRKAARGEVMMHPRVAARLVHALQGGPQKSPIMGAELSKREMEVLKSLSEGLSNAAIGEALFISEKTVKSHVSNILSKLHLADRTQAAVFAWREGLMKDDRGKK
jgi:two-component system, NarL family, response regulator LiaR